MKCLNEYINEWKLTNDSDIKMDPLKNPCEVAPGWTMKKIEDRYKNVFDNIHYIRRTGNVGLGYLLNSEYDRSSYAKSKFTLLIYDDEIRIRRAVDGSSGSGNNFIITDSVDKAFDKLDQMLRKKGYKV